VTAAPTASRPQPNPCVVSLIQMPTVGLIPMSCRSTIPRNSLVASSRIARCRSVPDHTGLHLQQPFSPNLSECLRRNRRAPSHVTRDSVACDLRQRLRHGQSARDIITQRTRFEGAYRCKFFKCSRGLRASAIVRFPVRSKSRPWTNWKLPKRVLQIPPQREPRHDMYIGAFVRRLGAPGRKSARWR